MIPPIGGTEAAPREANCERGRPPSIATRKERGGLCQSSPPHRVWRPVPEPSPLRSGATRNHPTASDIVT